MLSPRVVIAGGGSLGNIYPGVTIARHLRELAPGAKITIAGDGRAIERHTVRAAGLSYVGVPRRDRPRSLFHAPGFLLGSAAGWCVANWLLREAEADLVISLGGHASGPIARAARACQLPLVLVEPNASPYPATRGLADQADAVCLAYEETSLRVADRRAGPAHRRRGAARFREGVCTAARFPPPHGRRRRPSARGRVGGRGGRDFAQRGDAAGCPAPRRSDGGMADCPPNRRGVARPDRPRLPRGTRRRGGGLLRRRARESGPFVGSGGLPTGWVRACGNHDGRAAGGARSRRPAPETTSMPRTRGSRPTATAAPSFPTESRVSAGAWRRPWTPWPTTRPDATGSRPVSPATLARTPQPRSHGPRARSSASRFPRGCPGRPSQERGWGARLYFSPASLYQRTGPRCVGRSRHNR